MSDYQYIQFTQPTADEARAMRNDMQCGLQEARRLLHREKVREALVTLEAGLGPAERFQEDLDRVVHDLIKLIREEIL